MINDGSSITGCLLAGGQSRRMNGQDKSLLVFGNRPLLSHAIARLAAQVDAMVLNINGDASRFSGFGLPYCPDQISGYAGPLAGIHAGLCWAREHTPGASAIVSVACDTPFFPQNLVKRFIENLPDKNTVALAQSFGNRHPVCGLWPLSLTNDLGNWLRDPENRKVMAFVQRHSYRLVEFCPPTSEGDEAETTAPSPLDDPFFNINLPEDLALAESSLRMP